MFKQVFRTEVLDSEEVEINRSVYECKIEKSDQFVMYTLFVFSHVRKNIENLQ